MSPERAFAARAAERDAVRPRTSPIGRRLVLSILFASAALTLLISAYELLGEYRREHRQLVEQQRDLLASLHTPLAQSLWSVNDEQTRSLLQSLMAWDSVDQLLLTRDIGEQIALGADPGPRAVNAALTLYHPGLLDSDAQRVGELSIRGSLAPLVNDIANTALRLLALNALKALIVVAIALSLFNRLITRHLFTINDYLSEASLDRRRAPLRLARRALGPGDELEQISAQINCAQRQLQFSRSLQEQQQRLMAHKLDRQRRALEHAHQRLLAQDRLATIGSLTGMVAHELRNPLGAISASAALLKCSLDTGASAHRRALDRIDKAVARCERTIEEMRVIGTASAPGTSVADYGGWVANYLRHWPRREGIALHLDLAPGLAVRLDPFSQEQLLRNLLQNAEQAVAARTEHSGHGEIIVRLRRRGERAELLVIDNGIGIEAGTGERLFEPLFTTKIHGFGMGLAVARRHATRHGGTLSLHHRGEREGTVARLQLPLEGLAQGLTAAHASPRPAR